MKIVGFSERLTRQPLDESFLERKWFYKFFNCLNGRPEKEKLKKLQIYKLIEDKRKIKRQLSKQTKRKTKKKLERKIDSIVRENRKRK